MDYDLLRTIKPAISNPRKNISKKRLFSDHLYINNNSNKQKNKNNSLEQSRKSPVEGEKSERFSAVSYTSYKAIIPLAHVLISGV